MKYNSSGTGIPYIFSNLTSTTTGPYQLGFNISSGSTVDGSIINMSGSGGNAFVGVGTSYLTRIPKTLTVEGDISASGVIKTDSHITASTAMFTGLPTTEPLTTGSLWISGSGGGAASGSGYIMISGIHG